MGRTGKLGQETGQRQSGLGDRESTAHSGVAPQLVVRGDSLLHAQVNRAEDNLRFVRKLDESLDGRLSVHVDRDINDLAAVNQAVGRRVGPTPL